MFRQQIRKVSSVSSEAVALGRKYKFSFEAAKNQIIKESEIDQPQNIHNYIDYKRPQFTSIIEESDARLIPSVVTLHSRLNLPKSIPYNTITTCLNGLNDSSNVNNSQLSIFGANLLSYYVSEYLITNYPRLPLSIIRNATDSFIGDLSLYDLSKNQWGVEEDNQSKLDRYLNGEPQAFQFGKLKFKNNISIPEHGIKKLNNIGDSIYTAHANFTRSIISIIYAHEGEIFTKKFINNHIISRQIELEKMFSFKEPGKLLSVLLKSQNMSPFQIKLISETGRQSNSPVFVVGCYTGDELLSTAEGSSLKEARVKSTVKALLAWYLYKPLESSLPSDQSFNGLYIDEGEKFF